MTDLEQIGTIDEDHIKAVSEYGSALGRLVRCQVGGVVVVQLAPVIAEIVSPEAR